MPDEVHVSNIPSRRNSMLSAHSKFAQALIGFCGAVLAVASPGLCLAQGATPTQTTLSIAPSKVVQQGTSITLTAVVSSGGQAVHPGVVVFCNTEAPHCEDTAILGRAQLTNAGTAKIRLRLGAGSYSIKAAFQ